MPTLLEHFDSVRIINLANRTDRHREMVRQLKRIDAADDGKVSFFEARRPADAGPFPSVGARGCYESHLAIVRRAITDGVGRLLILEDDLDFSPDIDRFQRAMMALAAKPWDIFYGTPIISSADNQLLSADPSGIVELPPHISVQTTSCVAFARPALALLEPFLAAILGRPAGSPDFGPMHVDGAYSVFRRQFPQLRTFVCKPAIGAQRASRSDIAENRFLFDRFTATRPFANAMRHSLAWLRR